MTLDNFTEGDGIVNGSEYVLRISTPECNLLCNYCRTEDHFDVELIEQEEVLDIIKASVECGIKKLRWTGGEPTVTPNFLDMVCKSRDYGIESQMLSTNGTILYNIAEKLYKAGINGVNISLDTLDKKVFKEITGKDWLSRVLQSIDVATDIFDIVKLNCVLEKSTAEEIKSFIDYIGSYKNKKTLPVIRFIELIKGGFEGDVEYVKDNQFSGEDLVQIIRERYGNLTNTEFEGDNPMCRYYKIDDNGIIFGIIPHFSINFQCGGKRCKKLRLNPAGYISNCSIHKEFSHNLKDTSYEEKLKVIKHLILEKQNRGEEDFKKLKHYQADYQFWRFGKESEKK